MEVEHFRAYVRERRRDDCARFRGEYGVSGLTVGRCVEVCGDVWRCVEVCGGVWRCGMVWGGVCARGVEEVWNGVGRCEGGVEECVKKVWDGVGRRCGGGVVVCGGVVVRGGVWRCCIEC